MGRYSGLLGDEEEEEVAPGRYAGLLKDRWVRKGIFLVNEATGEKKLVQQHPGSQLGVGKEEDPYEGKSAPEIAVRQVAGRVKRGVESVGELYLGVEGALRDKLRPEPKVSLEEILQAQRDKKAGQRTMTTDVVDAAMASARQDAIRQEHLAKSGQEYDALRERLIDSVVARGGSPVAAATADLAAESAAIVADPTNFLPTGGALRGARAAATAERATARQLLRQEGLKFTDEAADLHRLRDVALAPSPRLEALERLQSQALPENPLLTEVRGDMEEFYRAWAAERGVDLPERLPAILHIPPEAVKLPGERPPRAFASPELPGHAFFLEGVDDSELLPKSSLARTYAHETYHALPLNEETEAGVLRGFRTREMEARAEELGVPAVPAIEEGMAVLADLAAQKGYIARRFPEEAAKNEAMRAELRKRGLYADIPEGSLVLRKPTPEDAASGWPFSEGVRYKEPVRLVQHLIDTVPGFESAVEQFRFRRNPAPLRAAVDGIYGPGTADTLLRTVEAEAGDVLETLRAKGAPSLGRTKVAAEIAPQKPLQREIQVSSAPDSPQLGISRLDPGEKLYVATDPSGRDVGSLIARQDGDGFRVRHVFVDESARGQAIPEQLYRQAHQELGPYRGSTDYAGRRTPAGEKMAARLQETAPEIFPPREGPEIGAGAPPPSGLAVASIGADGKLYYGKPGEVHFMLSYKHPEAVPWKSIGFAGPDGKFLTREEALAAAEAQPGFRSSMGKRDGLDSLDYAESQRRATIDAPAGVIQVGNATVPLAKPSTVLDEMKERLARSADAAAPTTGPDPAGAGGVVPSLPPQSAGTPPGEAGFIKPSPLQSLGRWAEENFTSGGRFNVAARGFADPAQRELVRGIPKRMEAMEGNYAVAMQRKARLLDDMQREVKKVAPSTEGRRRLRRDMHLAAIGEKPIEEIPAPLQRFVHEGSDLVDQLQEYGIREGALPAEIARSGGKYRHRAYAAFEDERWLEKVQDTDDWYAAKSFLQAELGGASEDEVLGIMMQLASREHGASALQIASGGPTRINSILKKREKIPVELRRLMGEYDDFAVSLEKTVHNLAWDIEAYRFWKELGDDGLAAGIFRSPKDGPTELLYRRMPDGEQAAGTSGRGPVAGLLTSEDLKSALLSSFEVAKTSGWAKASGWIKSAKTVLSVQTHGRNVISHGLTAVANGHAQAIAYKLPQYARAFRSQAVREQAVRHGIIGQGALSREVQDYISWMEGTQNPLAQGYIWATKKAQKAYQWEDDVPRFLQWMAETDDRVAMGMSRPAAEAYAADIVKETVQTYSRGPLIAQKLSRNPILGSPGVRFTFESARTLKNIAKIGARDIKQGLATGNRAQVWLGVKRMSGLAVSAMAGVAIARAARMEAGMDAEQEESFRRMVAPSYNRNTQMVFWNPEQIWNPTASTFEPGKEITYFDLGFLNPYTAVLRPLIAGQRAINEGAPAAETAYEVLNGIAGGDILAETALEVAFNRRVNQVWPPEQGGKLWNETDPPAEKLQAAAYRIYQGTAPGTAVTAERILRGHGVLPDTSRSGQKFKAWKEYAAIGGPRITTMEIPTAYRRSMGELGGLARDARSAARGRQRETGAEEAARVYLENWTAIYELAKERAYDGENLGMERPDMARLAEEAGLPRQIIAFALRGEATPPPPTFRPDSVEERDLAAAVLNLYRESYRP